MSVLDRYGLKKPFKRSVTPLLEAILGITNGHDHDGVNSKLITGYTKPETGIPSTDMTDAVQASLTAADAAYAKPEDGIPSTDLTAAVQASLALADSAMQGAFSLRAGKITLNGVNPSPVVFGDATAATVSTGDGTFDMTGVGDGGTIIINPDGAGNQTATINAAAGTSVSGASPSTDISGESDDSFSIAIDGGAAADVTLTLTGLDSGAAIAAHMQTQIRALGGAAAAVTVVYTTVYTVTSATLGTDSAIVIAAPLTGGSICEELKIGTAAGGTETAGTGDCANLAAVTAAEVAAVCTSDMTGLTAVVVGDGVKFTSATTGKDSSLVVGAGTLDTVLTLTNEAAYYGAQGLGYATDMADDAYFATATLNGVAAASLASLNISITNRTAAGFSVECETTASTAAVDLIIAGTAA